MVERIKTYRPIVGIKTAPPSVRKREERAKDVKFYQSAAWIALRDQVRREQPICAREGCHEITRHVHHIKPRKKHPELALERSNLEGLCIPHHNAEDER